MRLITEVSATSRQVLFFGAAGSAILISARCVARIRTHCATVSMKATMPMNAWTRTRISSDPWTDYARLCFVCATSARWHGRFSGGGVVADEAQLVFGREARAGVAGQHRLPAEAVRVVLVRWAERRGEGGGGGGRLAMLGDANQLNENPYDAEATKRKVWMRCTDLAERALAAAWPVSPPVYPAECAEIDAEVATLLQTNLRNPHTVRDSSVLMYNEFARDGTLQPLHRDSAEGRPLETVEVEMGGRGRSWRTPFATAEDYAPGVAAALLALYDELCSDAESAALDRPMVAVLTPHDHAKWGGGKPEQKTG